MRRRGRSLVCIAVFLAFSGAACAGILGIHEPIADGPEAAPVIDAGADVGQKDAIADAGPTCDGGAPFGTPVPLDTLNSPAIELYPKLTGDELTIYFASGSGTGSKIYVAERASRSAPFSDAGLLAAVN